MEQIKCKKKKGNLKSEGFTDVISKEVTLFVEKEHWIFGENMEVSKVVVVRVLAMKASGEF